LRVKFFAAQEWDAVERAVTEYSALPDEDVTEQGQWADFALGEFPRDERLPGVPGLD
jgi:hypothetical protein